MLLIRKGLTLAAKTIDRALTRLRASGQLVEPPRQAISASRRRPRARPYAVRKPRDYPSVAPGDLVQVDTLDVRPLPGLSLKQFTARDVVSGCGRDLSRATSVTAAQFLAMLTRRMPVPIRAIQVDGGSEFAAAFEEACQRRGIRLFVLPPRSPKLNGAVERANRTHTEEFYESSLGEFDLPVTASRSTAVGTHLQSRPASSGPRLFDASRVLAHHRAPRPPVSYVMTPYSRLHHRKPRSRLHMLDPFARGIRCHFSSSCALQFLSPLRPNTAVI